MLKAWRERRAERRAVRAATARFHSSTTQADIRSLRAAVGALQRAGVGVAVDAVDRFAVSPSRRYCALTLTNAHTYAVDLHETAYLHWPGAGVAGFDGDRLCLEPDESRFALEAWWVDPYLEDLAASLMPWQRGPVHEKPSDLR